MKKDGEVIINGVDTDIFHSEGRIETNTALYSRSSRIAEKGWEMARHWYTVNHAKGNVDNLLIAGKFSNDNLQYSFDFYNGEPYSFIGLQPREQLASIMRQSKYFLYSYFMDACPNTLAEAILCGCEIVNVYGMLDTGGAREIMDCKDLSMQRMISEYKEKI